MIRTTVTVKNKLGLHARAAAKLARCMQNFACNADIIKNGRRHNLKSVLELLMAGCVCDEEIRLEFDGWDEKPAYDAVMFLFEVRFNEPD